MADRTKVQEIQAFAESVMKATENPELRRILNAIAEDEAKGVFFGHCYREHVINNFDDFESWKEPDE